YPQWQGEPLDGKSLVVCTEQGFGDNIQFARYAPLIKARGASRLTFVVPAPLQTLFLSISSIDSVVSDFNSLPPHDFWVFPLSLPFLFGTTVDSIPNSLPYLHPSPDLLAFWRDRLPPASFSVGLVWKGNPDHANDTNRSLPSLASLAPLWSVPGVTFISLQKGQGEDEASSPPPLQPLFPLGHLLRDFADTAAVISQLDLIICVDSAIAHLAGALNVPCWVLLPSVGTDWRWLRDRSDSPWYPSALRLFHQSSPNDWQQTIQIVASSLTANAASRL
ncbi:MAG: pilus assembly protein PilF, partial [Rhodocyclaceae bacterium]|nr:pilus assembly protein PilF [Rhodocyclaceae bacterium]